MEKRIEDKTSETWARLKRLIKDLPADLISSSRVLLNAVDCVEILPPFSSGASGLQATLCLFNDCIVFVKRGWMEQQLSSRILSEQEDLRMQINLKNDTFGYGQMVASYRGSIALDKVRIGRSGTGIWITMLDDLEGKVSGTWTGRVERRFVPCVRQGEQIARFMDSFGDAKRLARGKVESSGVVEREGGQIKIDWAVIRQERYDEIKLKVWIRSKFTDEFSLIWWCFMWRVIIRLRCRIFSLSERRLWLSLSPQRMVSTGNLHAWTRLIVRITEENTLDTTPVQVANLAYTARTIGETLFSQSIPS